MKKVRSEFNCANEPSLTHAELNRFQGSLSRFKTIVPDVVYTLGIQSLAKRAGAYWLIDAIAFFLRSPETRVAIKRDERLASLQFWRLDVASDASALLSARADSDVKPFITQHIEFTDFPLDHVRIWAGFNGHGWTLYLPSEH